VLVVQNKPNFKRKKGNTWKKKKGKSKDEIHKPNRPAPKARPAADEECFHYKGKGHWKRNYKLYLVSSKKDSGSKGTPTAHRVVVYVTDNFLVNSYMNSWVFNTGLVVHICNKMHGMIRSRNVEKGEVDFRVGNAFVVAGTKWYGSATTPIELFGPTRYQWDQGYFQQEICRRVSDGLAENLSLSEA